MTTTTTKEKELTTITCPQAQALRCVMGKDLNLRAKKVACSGKKTVMEVYVHAKDWPFHKNPFDDDKKKKNGLSRA